MAGRSLYPDCTTDFSTLLSFFVLFFFSLYADTSEAYSWRVDVSPRLQWQSNYGYCGEISLIQLSLIHGGYFSQFDARNLANPGVPQSQQSSELLIGSCTDISGVTTGLASLRAARLSPDPYCGGSGGTAHLGWIKSRLRRGAPVMLGVYVNQFLDNKNTDPDSGDSSYDHIVLVTGVDSSYDDDSFHVSDTLYFDDHLGNTAQVSFGSFVQTRQGANSQTNGQWYSIDPSNAFSIAVAQILSEDNWFTNVRVRVNTTNELPVIAQGSTVRPPASPITLNITMENLTPGKQYVLCKYSDFGSVPASDIWKCQQNADQFWIINATANSTSYQMVEQIMSSDIRIYRAAPVESPPPSSSNGNLIKQIILWVSVAGGVLIALALGVYCRRNHECCQDTTCCDESSFDDGAASDNKALNPASASKKLRHSSRSSSTSTASKSQSSSSSSSSTSSKPKPTASSTLLSNAISPVSYDRIQEPSLDAKLNHATIAGAAQTLSIHPQSTASHANIIEADEEDDDHYFVKEVQAGGYLTTLGSDRMAMSSLSTASPPKSSSSTSATSTSSSSSSSSSSKSIKSSTKHASASSNRV